MTTLIIVTLSALVLYLLYKFGKYVMGAYMALCGIFLLSFPIMFLDLDFGAKIMVWSLLCILGLFLVTIASGFVGVLIAQFIVMPLSMMWMGLKGLILNK